MPVPPTRLGTSLKGLTATLLELLQLRLELFSVEAQEEILRVAGLLLYGALAVAFLSLGLGFLAMLITVALWDTHRLLPLAAFAVVFLVMGLVAGWFARERLRGATRLFSASIHELRQDREELRS